MEVNKKYQFVGFIYYLKVSRQYITDFYKSAIILGVGPTLHFPATPDTNCSSFTILYVSLNPQLSNSSNDNAFWVNILPMLDHFHFLYFYIIIIWSNEVLHFISLLGFDNDTL